MNNVTLVGRLVKDPEIKFTASGIAYSRFTLAVNRVFKSNDERKADFIVCVAWKKQAENLANFMQKGGLIGITGRIQTDKYQDHDGKTIYTTEVVADVIQFLERKNGGANNAPYSNKAEYQQPKYYEQRPPTQQDQPPMQLANDFGGYQGSPMPATSITETDDLPF